MAKNGHRTSHPNPTGPIRSAGGASLAVKDNANVRSDGINNPPVKNASPATGRTYPPSNPPTRGGRKVPGA